MIFIDTNYFLRLLRDDIKDQHNKAKMLFLKATEGKIELFTSVIVIFEIYWVLSRFYKFEKKEIVKSLKRILSMSFLKIDQDNILSEALDIYSKTNFDMEDSYNLVFAKRAGAKEFKTFDKKLLNYLTKQK